MEKRFELFTFLISKINRSIKKIKSCEMSEFNLKTPHVSCLYYIFKSEEITAKELCNLADEDKSAVSKSLEYLEKNGFLTYGLKNVKKYKTPIVLTPLGLEAGQIIAHKVDRMVELASMGVDDYSRRIMYSVLEQISKNLEKITNDYGDK